MQTHDEIIASAERILRRVSMVKSMRSPEMHESLEASLWALREARASIHIQDVGDGEGVGDASAEDKRGRASPLRDGASLASGDENGRRPDRDDVIASAERLLRRVSMVKSQQSFLSHESLEASLPAMGEGGETEDAEMKEWELHEIGVVSDAEDEDIARQPTHEDVIASAERLLRRVSAARSARSINWRWDPTQDDGGKEFEADDEKAGTEVARDGDPDAGGGPNLSNDPLAAIEGTTTTVSTAVEAPPSAVTEEDPPVEAEESEEEPPHFDVAQNAYGTFKHVWAWGKMVPVVGTFLGLTEAVAGRVAEATVSMDLPAIDQQGVTPQLKKLDGAVIDPVVLTVWRIVAPAKEEEKKKVEKEEATIDSSSTQ